MKTLFKVNILLLFLVIGFADAQSVVVEESEYRALIENARIGVDMQAENLKKLDQVDWEESLELYLVSVSSLLTTQMKKEVQVKIKSRDLCNLFSDYDVIKQEYRLKFGEEVQNKNTISVLFSVADKYFSYLKIDCSNANDGKIKRKK